MSRNPIRAALCAATFAAISATAAFAQNRVFVAAQGSDANPCTFAQPCRTLQHGHDTVTAGGEIDVLDPAGYGALTISKAISIQGHGFAGLAVPSGVGVTINAGASDRISLRGLLIDGVGTGGFGVDFVTGGLLEIQECLVRNFTGNGIQFEPAATSTLSISDTRVASNGLDGIIVSGLGTPSGVLDRVVVDSNGSDGVLFSSGTVATKFTISDSVISNSGAHGLVLGGFGNPAALMLRNVMVANNAANGVFSNGNTAVVRMTRSTVTGNATGLSAQNSASILSFGDNSVSGNTTDGNTTGSIVLK